jgi:hypothetical protein
MFFEGVRYIEINGGKWSLVGRQELPACTDGSNGAVGISASWSWCVGSTFSQGLKQ